MSQALVRTYRDLIVWQEAMELAAICYEVTSAFPKAEAYGLVAQIRRASTSIAANIAEGYGRDATGSYLQFLKIARGSLRELETHLLLAEKVRVASAEAVAPALGKCDSVGRLLHGLLRSVEKSKVEDS